MCKKYSNLGQVILFLSYVNAIEAIPHTPKRGEVAHDNIANEMVNRNETEYIDLIILFCFLVRREPLNRYITSDTLHMSLPW